MGTEFMIKLPQKEKGFFMKKLLNKANFALIGIFVTMSAHAAPGDNGLCELIRSMKAVFETLRTLAFVGAAFVIAGWAWGYISKGEVKKDDLKDKGTGMLVGFVMLFGIGMVLSFFLSESGMGTIGCSDVILNW